MISAFSTLGSSKAVLLRPRSRPNLQEPGTTGTRGWLVPVQWRALPLPYRPKDIISVLKPLLPAKYSPLQQSGDGLQSVYLAAVPEPMAKVLLDQMPGFSLVVLNTARTSGDDDGVVRT